MKIRKLNGGRSPVILGPADIVAIGRAVDEALPLLVDAGLRLLPSGRVEVADPAALDAVRELRGVVEEALPEAVREHVGQASGLGWNVFFGHVVAYWLPQRGRLGFLRALSDRAALHGVDLTLHWNQGRQVRPREIPWGPFPLIVGAGAGMVAGVFVQHAWPYSPILPLLTAGLGLVVGRFVQRGVPRRTCGDRLCRASLPGHADVCDGCGAGLWAASPRPEPGAASRAARGILN